MLRCVRAPLALVCAGCVSLIAPVARAQQTQAVALVPVPGAQALVLLESTRPEAVLERRVGSVGILGEDGSTTGAAGVWEQVCRPPCRVPVLRTDDLRVAGEGVRPSDPFRLPAGADVVSVRAQPASGAQHATGRALASTGIGLVLAGGALLLVPRPEDPTSAGTFDTMHTAGWGALAAGGLLALIGLPLWLGSSTHVETAPAGAPRTYVLAPGAPPF